MQDNFGHLGPDEPEDERLLPIGLLHIIINFPTGCIEHRNVRLEARSLSWSVSRQDDEKTPWEEAPAHGSRSAELLSAIPRLEATGRVHVRVRVVAFAQSRADAAASSPVCATMIEWAQLLVLPAGVALLELKLYFQRALLWYDALRVRRWLLRDRKAALTVLGALLPVGASLQQVGDAVKDLLEHEILKDEERYSLISCFRELPSVTRLYDRQQGVSHIDTGLNMPGSVPGNTVGGLDVSPLQNRQSTSQAYCPREGTCSAGNGSPDELSFSGVGMIPDAWGSAMPSAPIMGLPAEVLEVIMSRLDPLDLARLRATCTALAEAGSAGGAVPGVRLTLFPHQRAAIAWMIRRERGSGAAHASPCGRQPQTLNSHSLQQPCQSPHPSAPHDRQQSQQGLTEGLGRGWGPQRQQRQEGEPGCRHPMFVELVGGEFGLWAHIGTGELHVNPPSKLPEVRGGFFCDEPGLGKTITALSLVLKTLGQLPAPPVGAAVEWLANRAGKRVGFYTLRLTGIGNEVAVKTSEAVECPLQSPPPPGTATPIGWSRGASGGGVIPLSARRIPMHVDLAATASSAAAAPPPTAAKTAEAVIGVGCSPLLRSRRFQAQAPLSMQRLGMERAQADVEAADGNRRNDDDEPPPPPSASDPWLRGGSAGQLVSTTTDVRQAGGRRRGVGPRGAGRLGVTGGGSRAKRCKRCPSMDSSDGAHEEGLGDDLSENGEEDDGDDRRPQGKGLGGNSGRREEEEDDDDETTYSTDSDDNYIPGRSQRGWRSAGGGRRGKACLRQQCRQGPGGKGAAVAGRRAQSRKASETEDAEAFHGGGGNSQEVEVGGDTTWVQCEQCQAWRKLPQGHQAPGDDVPWFCHMHPIPEEASCTSRREKFELGSTFEDAPGYFRQHQCSGGSLGNVEYFVSTLRSTASHLELSAKELAAMSALRWLALQNPSAFKSDGAGVMTPVETRNIKAYDTVFRSLDLETLADRDGGGREGRRGRDGGGGREGGKGAGGRRHNKSRGRASLSAQNTWRAAPYMGELLLDIKALAAALVVLSSSAPGPTRIYLSGATLVVLPATLIDHWLLQIRTHVAPDTLRVCVLDRMDPRVTPSPSMLAWDYDVVITTFNRLSLLGAAAVASSGGGSSGNAWSNALSKIHWLRIILDEGHMLGASTAITNRLQAACRLKAERRWIMTGTPAPASSSSSAAHLQPLLAFLHHEPYGTNSTAWQSAIQRPLEACRPEGRHRLMRLLQDTMIRASKSDLVLLPRLVRKVTLLDFEPQHAASYNGLVEVVRRNLLTCDWCDDAHSESLLSSRNSRWSRQMMNNVWLSCCVAGSTNSVVKEEDLLETLQLLSGRLGLAPPGSQLSKSTEVGPPWLGPEHPLRRVEAALRHGTHCQVCQEFVRQPMVTPCGHLTCLDCTASDREKCPLPACRTPYVMQAVSDPARLKHNKQPKWPVPQELIEWQPVYHQEGAVGIDGGKWSVTWQLTRSSKITYMLHRLVELGVAPPPPLPPHQKQQQQQKTEVEASGTSGEATRSRGGGGGAAGATRCVPSALSAGVPRRFVARKKAIIFTQHGVHMQLIEASLNQADIPCAILTQVVRRELWAAEMSRFRHDPHCGVLLMDQLGAVGLDLSFVSYVLLMEPLADTSLEQQVVSRAHRMGAQQEVQVETLVMRGSAEEALIKLDRRKGRGVGVDTPAQSLSPDQHQQPQVPEAIGVAASCSKGTAEGDKGGRRRRYVGGNDGGGRLMESDASAKDVVGAGDLEGCVQIDRRALRNHLFLLLEKVRLVTAGQCPGGGAERGGGCSYGEGVSCRTGGDGGDKSSACFVGAGLRAAASGDTSDIGNCIGGAAGEWRRVGAEELGTRPTMASGGVEAPPSQFGAVEEALHLPTQLRKVLLPKQTEPLKSGQQQQQQRPLEWEAASGSQPATATSVSDLAAVAAVTEKAVVVAAESSVLHADSSTAATAVAANFSLEHPLGEQTAASSGPGAEAAGGSEWAVKRRRVRFAD